MAYAAYTIRVIARAIITKVDGGLGTAEDLALAYPAEEQAAILAQVYQLRPDLQPV